ncbi:hypothetical protein PRIPAC_80174, partial [Pristionchus pacificus]|uniref:Uncharacterized protein n=1 Tax=Pristionchus pacificus TaxID=54126 RepID=A0A2A6BI85_PRIPA
MKLTDLPRDIARQIIQGAAPELRSVQLISPAWNKLVYEYLSKSHNYPPLDVVQFQLEHSGFIHSDKMRMTFLSKAESRRCERIRFMHNIIQMAHTNRIRSIVIRPDDFYGNDLRVCFINAIRSGEKGAAFIRDMGFKNFTPLRNHTLWGSKAEADEARLAPTKTPRAILQGLEPGKKSEPAPDLHARAERERSKSGQVRCYDSCTTASYCKW